MNKRNFRLIISLVFLALCTISSRAHSAVTEYTIYFSSGGKGSIFFDDDPPIADPILLDFGTLGNADFGFPQGTTESLLGTVPGNFFLLDNVFLRLKGGTANGLRMNSDGSFCIETEPGVCGFTGTYFISTELPPKGSCPDNPGFGRTCAVPTINGSNWTNVRNGPNRWNPVVSDRLDLTVGVFPSVDSDDVPAGLIPLTDNGQLSVVSAAHPAITNNAFIEIPHGGLLSGRGWGWGTYARVFSRDIFDPDVDPEVLQEWYLRVENPGSPAETEVFAWSPPLDPAARPGLVTNVMISGAGLNPTISWTPNNLIGNEITRVSIYRIVDDANNSIRRIHGERIASGQNSFTIPDEFNGRPLVDPGDRTLIIGELYMILISNVILSTDGSQLLGSARSWFEFTALDGDGNGPAVFIPTVTSDAEGNKVFNFDIEVTESETIFIDPVIAIGYDYEVGEGDPGFNSLTLPNVGDGLFNLSLFDGDTPLQLEVTLVHGVEYFLEDLIRAEIDELGLDRTRFFDSNDLFTGVQKFRITGIETGAGLDPSDTLAFVTGLSFVSSGSFTGTMKPVTIEVADSIMVVIDIKPGDDSNCFNLKSSGVAPVSIFGSADFEVTAVDLSTLHFNWLSVREKGRSRHQCTYEHLNDDDYLDLSCKFESDSSVWKMEEGKGRITGELNDGSPFEGSDNLCIVPPR